MIARNGTALFLSMALFHVFIAAHAFGELVPRTTFPKPATITMPSFESSLRVKFRDDLKVRASNGAISSIAGADLSNVDAVTTQYGLTYVQSIQLPQATLDFVESRAAQRSGIAQPDLAGMMGVSGPQVTIEEAAQALLALDEIEYVEFAELNPEPPCVDMVPTTPDYFAQGLQSYHGPDPGLDMACAWGYGGRGQGIQIADCEGGYYRDHEDLCSCAGSDPPAECNIHEPVDQSFRIFENHGSAVLGVMVALDNEYGCTGLVPEATAWFFTDDTPGLPGPGSARENAIAAAIATVDPGDIILLEMSSASYGGSAPVEIMLRVWLLTKCATDSDIIVVAAAGNANQNLDGPAYNNTPMMTEDSGAIIVGAGTSDINHDRCEANNPSRCDWSNPQTGSTYGSRVNVQGWGENVFTLGYGFYAEHGGDENQSYIADFGGTSSAAPFVASAAAALQSLAECELGYRLTPAAMRQLLIDTGIPQGIATQGQHIGPFPDMAAAMEALGIASDLDGNGILDQCEPPGDPSPAAHPHDRRRNRYISFDPNKSENDGYNIAFKVKLKELTLGSCDGNGAFCRQDKKECASDATPCTIDADCPPGDTCSVWSDCNSCSVDGNACISQGIDCAPSPVQSCNATGETCSNDAPNAGGTNTDGVWWLGEESPLANGVHLMVSWSFRKISTNWPNPTHVGDCEIVPQALYGVHAVNDDSRLESNELDVETTVFAPGSTWSWGDGVGQLKKFCGGDIQTPECVDDNDCTPPQTCDLAWTLPEGVTGNDDINAALALISSPSAMPPPDLMWMDLHGNDSGLTGAYNVDPPNFRADFADVAYFVQAEYTRPYPFNDPADCPDTNAWPTYQAPTPPAGSPQFTLVASGDLFDPSEDVQIAVYLSEATNVFAHEVALEVTGGTSGTLTVTDITVDQIRTDYVFYGESSPLEAKDLPGMRVGSSLNAAGAGVTKTGQVYLATFTFQPTGGANGVFSINVVGETESFLLNPDGSAQVTDTSGTSVVGFGVDCLNDAHCDDNNQCTTDSCTANNECQYTNVASGTRCDDGLWCTAGPEACDGNGSCTGGVPRCPSGFMCDEAGQQCFGEVP